MITTTVVITTQVITTAIMVELLDEGILLVAVDDGELSTAAVETFAAMDVCLVVIGEVITAVTVDVGIVV